MADYSKMTPPEVWKLIRTGEITRPTAGMCAGYAQANLVILPKKYADDFKEFARKNPKPCPILEVVEGTPDIHDMGEGASIVTDIPKYFIYRDGVKVDEVTDVSSYWKEDSVAFLIGCSFSFEEALMKAGIEVRHIAGLQCFHVQDQHPVRERRRVQGTDGCQHASDDTGKRTESQRDHRPLSKRTRRSSPDRRSGSDRYQGYFQTRLW